LEKKLNRSIGILLVALVAFMSFIGAAVANDEAEDPEGAITTPMIVVNEEEGTITIALPKDGTLPECGDDAGDPGDPGDPGEPGEPGEPVDDAGAEEADGEDEPESYGPGDCIEFIMDHPSGKTHHGAVVSTVAKSLHPSMLDGMKKGEIMRWVAKGGSDDPTVEPAEKPEKAEKAEKAEKSDKQDKSDKPGKDNNPGKKDKAVKDGDHPGKGKGPNR
jgi:hypothetical protein